MPFYIISLIIIIYSLLINSKKGFIIFLGFNLFLNSNIALLSIPGIPVLSLQDVMIIIFWALSTFKDRKYRARVSLPWLTPYIILTIGYFFTCIFSVAGFGAEFSAFIKTTIESVVILILCWEYLETEQDFRLLFRVITCVFFVSCVYGLLEYSLQYNPLTLYEQTLNQDSSKVIDNTYEIAVSRGYRINSIFFHAIGAGCNWALYVIFTTTLYVRNKKNKFVNWFSLITAALSVICIILTKQRSPLIFLIIGIFSFFDIKNVKTYRLIFLGLIALVFIWPYLNSNIDILLSLFDKTHNVGGSSLEMRFEQFSAAFQLMKQSPLFGLGSKFKGYISNTYTDEILGMESIWLTNGIMYGIAGIIGNILLMYYQIFKIIRYFKIKYIGFLALAYWVTASLTTTPGFSLALYYCVLMYCIKQSEKYVAFDNEKRINEWKFKFHEGKICKRNIF